MSFYEFKSPPQMVIERSKQTYQYDQQIKKPKYRNLMFEKRICHGLTTKGLMEIELKETEKYQTQEIIKKTKKKFKNLNLESDQEINTNKQNTALIGTPRAKEGYADYGTATDEYFEELSNFFVTTNQSTQTDSLLSRALKENNIITAKGESIGTQIEQKDYLIDFDDQIQSVLRVLLNKVLEESRMETLEEIEMEKMKQQKSRAHQEKLKMLNKLQRAQAKEDRLNVEKEKRNFQNSLMKKNREAAHQKLCVRSLTKKLIFKAQMETHEYIDDVRNYLDIESAKIYTEILPDIHNEVMAILEGKDGLNLFAKKMIEDSSEYLMDYHIGNVVGEKL